MRRKRRKVHSERQHSTAQQSVIALTARQISSRREPRSPALSVNALRRILWRLSNEATQSSRSPSASPSGISVGIWRMVRVTGATTIPERTSTASDRVTTRTGRRAVSTSAHQISPCRGAVTTAPPRRAILSPRRGRWSPQLSGVNDGRLRRFAFQPVAFGGDR